MAKLGFLGLGIMGGPMARHLVMGGHNVAVWSHNQNKAKATRRFRGRIVLRHSHGGGTEQ